MNDVRKLYELWLEKTADNPEIHSELLTIKDNEDEIIDRFYRNLEFGTAIELPKSNVLAYSLSNGNFAIVRPSGTEPKNKVYITGCEKDRDPAEKLPKISVRQ